MKNIIFKDIYWSINVKSQVCLRKAIIRILWTLKNTIVSSFELLQKWTNRKAEY